MTTQLNSGKVMPRAQNIPVNMAAQPELHIEAREQVEAYSAALNERDRLRIEVTKLRSDLEVERRHCAELQHTIDWERERRTYFERYSVEVNTHLNMIAECANRARDYALDAAKADEPKLVAPSSSTAEP